MKKHILTLILSATVLLLTACPNNDIQEQNDIPEQKTENKIPEEKQDIKSKTEENKLDEEPEVSEDHVCENESTQDNVIEETEIPTDIEQPIVINPSVDAKPVIYLYPEKEIKVSISIDYNGTFTTTYPEYNDGWTVTAQPDGTITYNGREYYCLFWEGKSSVEYDLSEGFCVKGSETEKFLEEALSKLGLTDKEANEFIIYWLPKMETNKYNIISFQEELYTDNAELTISPSPDSLIRVFMAWKASDEYVELKSQEFTAPKREGFTVVEWGGSQIYN